MGGKLLEIYYVNLIGNLEKLRRKVYFALTEKLYATEILLIFLLNCYTWLIDTGSAVFRSLFFHEVKSTT